MEDASSYIIVGATVVATGVGAVVAAPVVGTVLGIGAAGPVAGGLFAGA